MDWAKHFSQSQTLVERAVSRGRFRHIMGVVETASQLAISHNLEVMPLAFAALLHDYTKELPKPQHRQLLSRMNLDSETIDSPALWHANTGYLLAIEEFKLPSQWAEPIRWHTTGKKNMQTGDMILYIADQVEPNRPWTNPSELELAQRCLVESMYRTHLRKIEHTESEGKAPHPNSVACLEWLLGLIQ